jgi:hypothetical protein
VVFLLWGWSVAFQPPIKYLSASFAFLQSITQLTLADRPQSISSSHELFVPSAHVRIEGLPYRELYVPTTFRLQGLITLLTACSLRSLAGFVSHRQHSWDSPLRSLTSRQVFKRFRLKGPTYRFACRCSPRRSIGPAQRAPVSGFCPCRGLRSNDDGFSIADIGSSLGVRPSRVLHEGLDQDFARSPLTRFAVRIINDSNNRHLRVSMSLRLVSAVIAGFPTTVAKTTLLGFLHLTNPRHSNELPPGL